MQSLSLWVKESDKHSLIGLMNNGIKHRSRLWVLVKRVSSNLCCRLKC